ncbi:hypothetical protein CDL15_Pgr013327 [Punica granatum]|uniref:Protein XRI1-like n=1 Tax=Punica granatum TaxID=22663 RepID=A0A218WP89_PUNGR|nr:hypothetical protein CDL15_Pgr013327 [Punica granatum]
MESTPPYFSTMAYDSSNSDDRSTGYLQDALVEYGGRSKRRRSLLYGEDLAFKSYWNSNCSWGWGPLENLNCTSHISSSNSGLSGTNSSIGSADSRSQTSYVEEGNVFPEIQTPKEATTILPGLDEILDCSSPSFKDSSKKSCNKTNSDKVSIHSLDTVPYSSEFSGDRMRKKRVIKRLVYPFALVKPGGTEGDVTLNDINERILMPPTRPVRHPVGDFACRPTCVSPHGPGLSGKAVVALTRIHTQGRGTITIIRTKG